MATLLLIDDSDDHRAVIHAAVADAGIVTEVVEASSALQGLRVMLEQSVDVVLCRLEMAGLDGSKLLSALAGNPSSAAAPIVYLTSRDDAERRARLLASGATDVLTLPVHEGELVERLRRHLRLKMLQDDLRVKNETLSRISTVDGLTGLRTRRYVDDYLSIEFLRARRYGNLLTVMMGDLDHFKGVNDDFGHQAGDAALKGVASLLMKDLRRNDVAGRFGGEEILVVLAQSQLAGAQIFADRWRREVEAARFSDPTGQEFAVTISIGVASLDPHMKTPEDLVGAADAALYRAKENGRNRVEASALPADPTAAFLN